MRERQQLAEQEATMADMSKGARRSWQDSDAGAGGPEQMSSAPSAALVISAIWWALVLHAILSVLGR